MSKNTISRERLLKFLQLTGMKKNFSLEWLIKNRSSGLPPARILNKSRISKYSVMNKSVWQIPCKQDSGLVFFIHGGGYVQNLMPFHWDFCCRIAENTGCGFILPDYPLAPESEAPEAIEMLLDVYSRETADRAPRGICLMGDSAGGGLAVILAQNLIQRNLPLPERIILLSPWLDAALSDECIEKKDNLDPVLSVSGLKECASVFAGNNGISILSPLDRNLKDLPRIDIFSGTHDILNCDSRRCCNLIPEKEAVRLHEFPEMFHNWFYFPLKETEDTIAELSGIIGSEQNNSNAWI